MDLHTLLALIWLPAYMYSLWAMKRIGYRSGYLDGRECTPHARGRG